MTFPDMHKQYAGGFFGWMLRLRCAIKGRHLFVPTKNRDLNALICYYCDEVMQFQERK